MFSGLAKYNKLWAAMATMVVMVMLRKFDVSIPGLDQIITDLVVGALGSFGVYQVSNAKD